MGESKVLSFDRAPLNTWKLMNNQADRELVRLLDINWAAFPFLMDFLVSKETVVLRRRENEKKLGFIKRVERSE